MNCHDKSHEAQPGDMIKMCKVCGTILVDVDKQRELIEKLNTNHKRSWSVKGLLCSLGIIRMPRISKKELE